MLVNSIYNHERQVFLQHRQTIIVSSSEKDGIESSQHCKSKPGKNVAFLRSFCRDLKPSMFLSDDSFILVGRDKIINTHCKISF